jgi:hypothetical protein
VVRDFSHAFIMVRAFKLAASREPANGFSIGSAPGGWMTTTHPLGVIPVRSVYRISLYCKVQP